MIQTDLGSLIQTRITPKERTLRTGLKEIKILRTLSILSRDHHPGIVEIRSLTTTLLEAFLKPIHSTPEENENGGFTLKTYQLFSVHTTLEEYDNAKITGSKSVFEKLRFREGLVLTDGKA